ncbi:MAG: endo alpha-1,4 polygalactosaminidase [candidate division KSB1 bacterium]|nr:endo alpha-1,4 polygalactosaminidase [candidate division KSB1 bacterium]
MRKSILVLTGIVLILSGCSPWLADHRPDTRKALPGLEHVQSFAVVYQHIEPDQLMPFDMVILEAEHYRAEEIEQLRRAGKTVIGYVNVGEIEAYRVFANQVPERWKLADNQHWPGHTFINPGWKGWRILLRDYVLDRMREKGFHGLFLDSVDLAAPWRFPKTRADMVKLIRWLHREYPEMMLILNNGLFILNDLVDSIHGLLIEELFFTIDQEGRYTVRPTSNRITLLKDILRAKTRWNLPVFLVDYCPAPPPQICHDIKRVSGLLGLPHFVTDYYLTQLYPEINVAPVEVQQE